MLKIARGLAGPHCDGFRRRTALKVGACGALNLSLPDLLRAEAANPAGRREKSVILIWLDGGPVSWKRTIRNQKHRPSIVDPGQQSRRTCPERF